MAPLSEIDEIEIRKGTTDFAGSTVEAASPSPRVSFGTKEILNESSTKHANSAIRSGSTEDSEYQPQAPTRSVTINNQQSFEKLARMIEQACPSGTEQPFILNFGKIEIINGSVSHYHPSPPKSASDVETVETNPDKSGQKIKRSESQMTQTTRVALERFLVFWDRLARLPRLKPFTVWRLVKDANNKWQDLEVCLDTGGGAGNLIPYSKVEALGLLERIQPSSIAVFGLGGNEIKTEGSLDIVGQWNGSQECPVTFQVVDKDNKDITETMLGAESISTFKLLRIRFAGTRSRNGHGVNPKRKGNDIDLVIQFPIANEEQ